MMKIVFATNNEHKLKEVREILKDKYEVLSLADIGCHEDIPEKGHTLIDNAAMKAKYVYDHYHIDCFADDTGLFVEALNGEPGVYSARYANMQSNNLEESHDSEANMRVLLEKLGNNPNRKAYFSTVIALIRMINGLECVYSVQFFQGTVEGEITREPNGIHGFGYDPIFKPDGYTMTYAAMSSLTKNEMSHRAIATRKLADCLLGNEK